MILKVEKKTRTLPIETYWTFYVAKSGEIPYVTSLRYSESAAITTTSAFRWVPWDRSTRYNPKYFTVNDNPKRIPEHIRHAAVRGIFQEPIE